MNDIKLFNINCGLVSELVGSAAQIEKDLQILFEKNLETLLGIRFIASEFGTGPVHNGRIDTLGLDEDGCPVIIEYKRSTNENVINQGLYYLHWMMDHKGDFERLVHRLFGHEDVERIDWSNPRLLCIAGDFTRYVNTLLNKLIETWNYYGTEDSATIHSCLTSYTRRRSLARRRQPGCPLILGRNSPRMSIHISHKG